MKQVFKVARFNFFQWRRNKNVYLCFLLAFLMCSMLADKAILFASNYGLTLQIFETFIWTFGDANSILLSSLLLLLLFSDMPFIEKITPYYLVRCKRTVWIVGQVLYVVLSTVIYILFLLFVTCICSVHISFLGNKWSKTSALLGQSGIGGEIALPTSIKTLEMSSPYKCVLVISVLLILYALLVAMLMLLFNLHQGKYAGVLSVLGLNLFGLLLNPQIFLGLFKIPDTLAYKANVLVGWLSPLNHATYYMHNFGYDYLPRIWQSVLLFMIAEGVILLLIIRAAKKYEI